MRKIAITILSACAKAVIRKYQPKIIAVTGTVGKSSAKEAIFATLKNYLVVRASSGNYNTQIGVPLSVLDLGVPGRSPLKWLRLAARAAKLLLKTDHTYPDVLILEMGADKPGDIEELVSIASPNIAVITAITPVHLQKYGSFEALQKEKAGLWKFLGKNGIAVGNIDDPIIVEEMQKIKIKKVSYGTASEADVRAGEKTIYYGSGDEIEERIKGTAFKFYSNGSVLPVHLSGVYGSAHILSALAGAAVGLAMGLNSHEIIEGLRSYKSLPGRMRLLPGVKHTLILDDTYNASPAACLRSLEDLKDVPISEGNKYYAVLGDMLELGAESERFHREVGRRAAELGIDVLLGVGELAAEIIRGAREAGMDEGSLFHFANAESAGKFVEDRIKQGDVILVKGSRGRHMEIVVRELMAEPERAEELLVH